MKIFKTLIITMFLCIGSTTLYAQTAEEIISTYIDNTGGIEAWNSIEGLKFEGKVNMGGQEFPFTMLTLRNGKMLGKTNLQGTEFIFQAFDGETMWGTNFTTMKPEAQDKEASENFKKESKDFPDAFHNYTDKGYSISLLGKETVEGVECFKIQLTKSPSIIDGKEEDNIVMYFFDTENFVPIMSESEIKSGQAKGMKQQTIFSDYQEVGENGAIMAFTTTSKFNGNIGQTISIETVKINPTIDESAFSIPSVTEKEIVKKQ